MGSHRGSSTRRDLVLRLLREAGGRGVTTSEMLVAGVGSRYSARLLELRERGHEITSERVGQGQWRYRLVRGPAGAAVAAALHPHVPSRAAGGEDHLALFDPEPAAPRLALFDWDGDGGR